MTSTASQTSTNPAPNTTAASTAPSYASAAGTAKKPSSTPLVVTGTNPPSVVGSSAASTQNAESNSNGRSSAQPPTVAHGSSNVNGQSNHNRDGSVTINAPNAYNGNRPASSIQFGFEKTPQPTPSAPVPIPGAQRIPSPAQSPSPIPQPSASGGKPGATDSAFKIGSFTNDGDRGAARPGSVHMPFHNRRDSTVSTHSDASHHAGQGGGRGFPPSTRGRSGFNHLNHSSPMGYPPGNQYRPPQGRNSMPPQGYGRGPVSQYPNNSPQPARGSPAMPPAMPGQGTPNMNTAVPVPPVHYGHHHQYPPPMAAGFPPPQAVNVNHPISHDSFAPFNNNKPYSKKKGARWDSENKSSHLRQPNSYFQASYQDFGGKARRLSKRRESTADYDRPSGRGLLVDQQMPPYFVHSLPINTDQGLDLSPGQNGGFERVNQLLTASKQYPNQFYDHGRNMFPTMPAYGHQVPMYQSPGSPAPGGFAHPYGGSQFPPPAQPMSRNNSQMSERPASSTGQPQGPMVASGPTQSQSTQQKGPVIASSTPNHQFVKPKSTAIKIQNAAGEVVNLANLRAPVSPAPSIQQSKTPPVIASTPTPPPKTGTPASHNRNESASTTNINDIKAAFMEQVKKSKEEVASKVDEKPSSEIKAKDEQPKQEENARTEQKPKELKAPEEPGTKIVAEEKAPKPEPEIEEKKADDSIKADDTAKSDDATKVDEKPAETEEEYMERMIREMEEEDARREAEQAKITAQKQIEKEAAKKKAEEERKAAAAENDRALREQEREMERLEDEKMAREKAREEGREVEEPASANKSITEVLTGKISDLTSQKKDSSGNSVSEKLSKLTINSSSRDLASPGSAPSSAKSTGKERAAKPAALNLAPLKTSVEAPPPSAAMMALKSSRFLSVKDEIKYPNGIASPNPALNAAAAKKGGSFKYDSAFLLQFQKVFTEQPSVEFSQQVKALIGDSDGSRSASTRASAAGGTRQGSRTGTVGPMGSFAQPAGKTLPPGTTSDQRFAMSQGQLPRPALGGMASFGRGGAFPSGSQMSRQPSSNMASGSRSGSRNQPRGASKRGFEAQNDAKAAKTMPLTAGQELKPITTSANGWKPASLLRSNTQNAAANGHLDPETVQRKVKAALNKMTPENFEKISEQILQIAAQSKDEQDGRTLRQVIQLTFEKATDESHWAAMYAKFCKRMLENMSSEVKDVTITDKNGNVVSGGALFRKYLLNRCQEDFERGWAVEMPEPKEGETKETAMMSDEYYKAMAIKRRGLGLVQFIGELFKLGMLTERIMHECVRKLLDFSDQPDEAEIESLSKLLRTIGANLDSTDKGTLMMNAYFERISTLIEAPDLPSRLQFMLMDIVDLRKAKWQTKEGLKGPKTLEEIRADAEAAAAAKAAEASRTNSRNQAGGRSQLGRGDARGNFSYSQPASNQVGMDDLRRLKGSASRTASGNVTLGPTSMFNSRSSSGRKLGPGGALTRGAEDSGASSRTGTPPTQASVNAFAALANMESENPASPPSTAASPALNHAKPDTAGKEAE